MDEEKNTEETLGETLKPKNVVQKILACRKVCGVVKSMMGCIKGEQRKPEEYLSASLTTLQ